MLNGDSHETSADCVKKWEMWKAIKTRMQEILSEKCE